MYQLDAPPYVGRITVIRTSYDRERGAKTPETWQPLSVPQVMPAHCGRAKRGALSAMPSLSFSMPPATIAPVGRGFSWWTTLGADWSHAARQMTQTWPALHTSSLLARGFEIR
jgi:hypothetical protein